MIWVKLLLDVNIYLKINNFTKISFYFKMEPILIFCFIFEGFFIIYPEDIDCRIFKWWLQLSWLERLTVAQEAVGSKPISHPMRKQFYRKAKIPAGIDVGTFSWHFYLQNEIDIIYQYLTRVGKLNGHLEPHPNGWQNAFPIKQSKTSSQNSFLG